MDEDKHFPVDVLRKAAGLGFAGLYVREDVGGSALTRLDASIVFEQLSYGDVPTAAFLYPQHGLLDDRPVRL